MDNIIEDRAAPFFSVIVPCYNGEEFIESAIQSLEKQSHQDFEIIVVNDGSTDNSAEILEQLERRIASLILIHQANKGLPAARNAAIEKASGKWIVLLDADDIFLSDRLEHLHRLVIDAPECHFFFHDSYRIDENDMRESETYIHRKYFYDDLKRFFICSSQKSSKVDSSIWQFLLCNYTAMIPISICMSAELVNSLSGPFDESLKVGEDVDFCVRCLSELDHIIYSDVSLTEYRVHGSSMTHNDNYIFRMLDYYQIMKNKFYGKLSNSYRRAFKEKYSSHCLSASYTYRKNGNPLLAIKYATKSLLLDFSLRGVMAILKGVFPARV